MGYGLCLCLMGLMSVVVLVARLVLLFMCPLDTTTCAHLYRQCSSRITQWSQFLLPCKLKVGRLWKWTHQSLGSLRVLDVPGYTDTTVMGYGAATGD